MCHDVDFAAAVETFHHAGKRFRMLSKRTPRTRVGNVDPGIVPVLFQISPEAMHMVTGSSQTVQRNDCLSAQGGYGGRALERFKGCPALLFVARSAATVFRV